jgi:hypothetical protein
MTPHMLRVDHGDGASYAADALEILGVTTDCAIAWRWHLRDGSVTDEHTATEDELETLLRALRAPETPIWPREVCRYCDTDAVVEVEGDPLCNGHAMAHDAARGLL